VANRTTPPAKVDASRVPPPNGAWIKVRTNLWDDPRVVRLCDLIDTDEARIVGGLVRLWSLADAHSTDGTLVYSPGSLDRKIGILGFADALQAVGWLQINNAGICVPRFDEHNGKTAKRRAQDASRQARHYQKTNPASLTASSRSNREDTVNKRRDRGISEKESSKKTSGQPPAGLLNLIAVWNQLAESGSVPHKANSTPPAKAVLKAWSKAQKTPELCDALANIPALEAAIRGSPFVHAGWFRLEKLIAGTNNEGTFILTKLLDGGYADQTDHHHATQSRKGNTHANRDGLSYAQRTEQATQDAVGGFLAKSNDEAGIRQVYGGTLQPETVRRVHSDTTASMVCDAERLPTADDQPSSD